MNIIPVFHKTFIPILQTLKQEQKIINVKELKIKVRNQFYNHLSTELLTQRTSTGANKLLDRIGWGLSFLTLSGYVIRPTRGNYQITSKGIKTLESGNDLSLKEVKKQAEYLQYQANLNKKSSSNTNTINDNITDESTPDDLIDKGIKKIENEVKNQLLDKLKQINPYDFEQIILDLLNAMGYGDTINTNKSHDGGIDGIVNEDKLGLDKIYIQAKRFNNNKVRETEIRNFIGAMSGDTTKGIFVTTTEFENKALEKANNAHHKIKLIDGNELVKLMFDYGIGVQVKKTIEIKKFDNDFFEE